RRGGGRSASRLASAGRRSCGSKAVSNAVVMAAMRFTILWPWGGRPPCPDFYGRPEARPTRTNMNSRSLSFAIAIATCLAATALAGKYNKTLSIGDAAPQYSELEGVDGKPHGLADLKDKEVVVLCFTCNTCPYAVDYEDRLIALAKKLAADGGNVALVAINP